MAFRLGSPAAAFHIWWHILENGLAAGDDQVTWAATMVGLGYTNPLLFPTDGVFRGFRAVLQRVAADEHTRKTAIPVSNTPPPADWLGWAV